MIKPILWDTVFFRVPRFSYQEPLTDNWELLKQLIKDSSPDFYEIIADLTLENLADANEKVQQTVQKYYNRAAFRSTPYGAFATVGIGKLDWKAGVPLELAEEITTHRFPDWRNQSAPSIAPSDLTDGSQLHFFANTTFYRVQEEIRYIKKEDIDFHIAGIDNDPIILQILNYCRIPKTWHQIKGHLEAEDAGDLKETICDLIGVQLILTSRHPNIIGKDYFARTGTVAGDIFPPYLIAERKVQSGSFEKNLFRHLPELIVKLQQLSTVVISRELKEFKDRFLRKFEQTEVLLLEALDPEIGIGYGGFTAPLNGNPLTRLAAVFNRSENNTASPLREALYREMLLNSRSGQPIDLDSLITETDTKGLLPNTITALCSVADNKVFLHSIGGISATAIPARFALALPELETHCREMATWEQQANPDVLFFDIGYTNESRIDNINRRPSLYDYQLNLLNYDTSVCPLSANDILVSVQAGQILLKSRSLQKRLMPRMASAYNYNRSDLALLRFLMDVQSQSLLTGLSLRPAAIIPGLPYYPRIQFQNIIVAPATWHLSVTRLQGKISLDEKYRILQDQLRGSGHCKYFKAGLADQTLCLDIDSKADMELLRSLLEKQKQLYIEETMFPSTSIIQDASGKPMLGEVVLTLTHSEQIIMPLRSSSPLAKAAKQKHWVAPGSNWLYFEIFIHPLKADDVLIHKIQQYLKANSKKIRSWFFIRYNEDGDHIRMRLKLSRAEEGYLLIGQLSALLDDELSAGIVSDIRLRTYKKEVHRYSEILMEQVEGHFCTDSKFVLAAIKGTLSDTAKYQLCLAILDEITGSGLFPTGRVAHIGKKVAAALGAEYALKTEGYKELNLLYRNIAKAPDPALSHRNAKLFYNLTASLKNILEHCDTFQRPQMLIDLMHMHINRLFPMDQRLHELAVYNAYILKCKTEQHKQPALGIRA